MMQNLKACEDIIALRRNETKIKVVRDHVSSLCGSGKTLVRDVEDLKRMTVSVVVEE